MVESNSEVKITSLFETAATISAAERHMKNIPLIICGLLLALIVTACGGGGSVSTTGTTATTSTTSGGGAFTLSGNMVVNGGQLLSASAVTAGTQTIVLVDTRNHNATFTNVLLPLPISGFSYVTVVRAGSKLFGGTYTSRTAQCLDRHTGIQGTLPLNADGTLAQDIAIDEQASIIVLPVSSDGALTFSNGVRVSFFVSSLADNTHDVTLTANTSATNIPAGNNQNNITGTVSFSGGGTANTTGQVNYSFHNSLGTIDISCAGATPPPNKSSVITGTITGSGLPIDTTLVSYSVAF